MSRPWLIGLIFFMLNTGFSWKGHQNHDHATKAWIQVPRTFYKLPCCQWGRFPDERRAQSFPLVAAPGSLWLCLPPTESEKPSSQKFSSRQSGRPSLLSACIHVCVCVRRLGVRKSISAKGNKGVKGHGFALTLTVIIETSETNETIGTEMRLFYGSCRDWTRGAPCVRPRARDAIRGDCRLSSGTLWNRLLSSSWSSPPLNPLISPRRHHWGEGKVWLIPDWIFMATNCKFHIWIYSWVWQPIGFPLNQTRAWNNQTNTLAESFGWMRVSDELVSPS